MDAKELDSLSQDQLIAKIKDAPTIEEVLVRERMGPIKLKDTATKQGVCINRKNGTEYMVVKNIYIQKIHGQNNKIEVVVESLDSKLYTLDIHSAKEVADSRDKS